ncbi:putative quorum-sensing-regulated virulence factor [Sulfuriroseicoccus oceanibius]|uniref:DUF3820 family protein n=1 Tax=Sulfuriroseicoccus oceanibius TaxID=2707525 RepID=A0A6B3L853_9BACT|nr:DUF3820 family protein [Sulfuriroseicoccus oceanibius]QQL46269.1 DUF3820 family protein [Sulfuriroseicoccus oceanibius]
MEEQEFKRLLMEIGATTMPFGKYGPDNYPPNGLPIDELPWDYLHWFTEKGGGFPKGRLGELLEIVYHAKGDGADAIFAVNRSARGGRRPQRKPRQKDFRFD